MPQPLIGEQINIISCLSHLLLTFVAVYLHFKAFINLCKNTKKHSIETSDVVVYIGIWVFNFIILVADCNFLLNIIQLNS